MKEQKTTEIATNKSSGAEKVEIVEKQVKAQENGAKQTSAQKTVEVKTREGEKTVSARTKKPSAGAKAQAEEKAAKARVDAALKKEKEKLSRKEAWEKAKAERRERLAKLEAEQKAKAEKRAAERKAKAEKRAAEKKALIEKRKAEREARIRERAHAKANRSQEKSKAKREKTKNKENKQGNGRESRKGYGGWLAAVISLGAVTLALATVVTVGAIDMRRTNEGVMGSYRSTSYELMGIMENVENDLDRARVSASATQQDRILTDLLVQARLAELDLEKMPVAAEKDRNLTSFINRVARESERMLSKLRNGEALDEHDEKVLQELYETNRAAREQLGDIAETMTDDMLRSYIKKGEGALAELIDKIENATLDENRLGGEREGAGMRRSADAPPMGEENAAKIEPSKAEELCAQYFASYNIGEFQCIGETVARDYTAYNVQGYDKNGTLLFAEVDCASGALLRFDYYEDCNSETFDMQNAQRIAEEFLTGLGYKDMTAARVRESGTDADFTFVYTADDVAFYPDTVHVKICRTRGVVTGFDATKYVRNHRERGSVTAALSLPDAQAKLHDGLTVEQSRLVVVGSPKGERAAYEFLCAYGEEKYVIYTDANSGAEIAIVNLRNLG